MIRPIAGNKWTLSKVITGMTKADALAPIAALEATVVLGRTYQAYKRGKGDEARERFIEESMGSIVWLCGVKYLNKLGDKVVGKILKSNGTNFDVGTDKVLRTPFENFMKTKAPKGFTPNQVALIKGAKVMTSIVLANLFIGFIVPPLNQALTRKVRGKRKAEQEQLAKSNAVAFKGGAIGSINKFTNWIENTNTGQLLSSDAGIAGGRMYNARRKEERREIAIRDIGSIYFYMWAQGHVRSLLNLAETGKASRLNPGTAEIFSKQLIDFIGNKEMGVNEFKEAVLGKETVLPEKILNSKDWEKGKGKNPLEVIKIKALEGLIDDKEILERAREMSKLQPERVGERVITKQQLKDAFNKAEINNPELLNKVFNDFTGGDYKNEFKYVSNKKLYNLKAEMEHYVERFCKSVKDGKINKSALEKFERKNLIVSGVNFAAGFAVAAAFLSTLIPKFQYWFTKKTTGVYAFPGVYEFEKEKK